MSELPVKSRLKKKPAPKKKRNIILIVLILIISIFSISAVLGKNNREPIEKTEETLVKKVNEKSDKDSKAEVKEVTAESDVTYEDFKGVYIPFSGEPYNSPIVSMGLIQEIDENTFQYTDRWESSRTSAITKKTIEGNTLTLGLTTEQSDYFGSQSESEQFELRYENGMKYLRSISNNHAYYAISNVELEKYYDPLEIDYARIIMSVINGSISLDSWAVYSPVTVYVSRSYANKPLNGSVGAPSYPKNVTHLSSNILDTFSHESGFIRNGSITYSADGKGNITFYQPNNERIEEVGNIYVDPFKPYEVVDFISNVEFIYK